MQKLILRHFGPIKDINLDVKDILILNGLQSSGKSTLAKVIYMFKELPNSIFKFIVSDKFKVEEFEKSLVIILRLQFLSIFGTTKHFDKFYMRYDYCDDKHIEVKKDLRSGHAYIKFSYTLKKEIKNVVKKYKEITDSTKQHLLDIDISYMQINKIEILQKVKQELKIIFQEKHETIFIPAGRSLVSTLSGELKNIESYNFDYLMKDFVQRIFYMRDIFSKNLDEILEDRKRLSSAPINFDKVKLAQKIITNILQGKYVYENGEEKIVLDDEHFVKIKFASSGQQEVLWILNILYIIILENRSSFIVYEEPEAHLYPITQYEVFKLIGLFLSNKSNQGIITTHSPYIMSALNNLLFAFKIGDKKVEKIIPKDLWINYNKISAYFIENGEAIDMMDNETHLINTEYIDRASEILNDDFEKLLELDYE